jgi:hypothetical protein
LYAWAFPVDALKGLSAMQNKSLGVAMLVTVSHLPVVVIQLWIDWFYADGANFPNSVRVNPWNWL